MAMLAGNYVGMNAAEHSHEIRRLHRRTQHNVTGACTRKQHGQQAMAKRKRRAVFVCLCCYVCKPDKRTIRRRPYDADADFHDSDGLVQQA